MRFLAETVGSRREFFRDVARYTLLGLMTAAAWLMERRQGLAGQKCINRGICNRCGEFARCGLPQALSAKQAKTGRT